MDQGFAYIYQYLLKILDLDCHSTSLTATKKPLKYNTLLTLP